MKICINSDVQLYVSIKSNPTVKKLSLHSLRLINNDESRAVQAIEVNSCCKHVDGDATFIFIKLPVLQT